MTEGDIPRLKAHAADAQRTVLVNAAAQMLQTQGVDALSLRKLAQRVGASTSAVYTLFGNKDGLLRALAIAGLDAISEGIGRLRGPVNLQYIARFATAYRKAALANPTFYRVLQMGVVREELAVLGRASQAYQTLWGAVQTCMDAGLLEGQSTDAVVDSLWTMVHGHVSLELAGYWPSAKIAAQRFTHSGWAALRGLTPTAGTDA